MVPFLVFGAAAKTWVLMFCLLLYFKRCLSRRVLFEFGVKNGLVAAFFWAYIATSL